MRNFRLFSLTLLLSVFFCTTAAFAGEWHQEGENWKYQNDDGSFARSQWIQDADNSWYYIGEDGNWDSSVKADIAYVSSRKETGSYTYRLCLTAFDTNGTAIWNHSTPSVRITNLYNAQYFENGNMVYVIADGILTVLDRNTGNVLWENSDFQGASESHVFDGDNTLYLSGQNGPDVMAIDCDGNTLWRIDSASEVFKTVNGITLDDNIITVYYADFKNPNKKSDRMARLVRINPDGSFVE